MVASIDADYDVICTATGTGATLAGIIEGISASQQAMGFAVLKGASFLDSEVACQLSHDRQNWHLTHDYHFGGYARAKPALFSFMQAFRSQFGFELDAVYTARMFYGLFDLIRQGHFDSGTRLLALHTGGLQGNKGFGEHLLAARHADSDYFSAAAHC